MITPFITEKVNSRRYGLSFQVEVVEGHFLELFLEGIWHFLGVSRDL
jgi:hypothetical protein